MSTEGGQILAHNESSDECDLLIRDSQGNIRLSYDADFYKNEPKTIWKLLSSGSFCGSNETETQLYFNLNNSNETRSSREDKSSSLLSRFICQAKSQNEIHYAMFETTHTAVRQFLRVFIYLICGGLLLTVFLSLLGPKEAKERELSTLGIQKDLIDSHDASRWLVSQSKCHIPTIEPWHESIRGYVHRKAELNCREISREGGLKRTPLTYTRSNKLYLNGKYNCCYRLIERVDDSDTDLRLDETCYPILQNPSEIPFELIKVECPAQKYSNVHMFIKHNPSEEEAMRRVADQKLNREDYYNVLMVGVDTISRLNGMRQLNETLSVLKDKYNTTEFLGYNKVGENTFPNLIPLLTGMTPEELVSSGCWSASNYSDESESGDDFLDNCKFLWNFFHESGYISYYSEDWPKASTFNYLKEGFKFAPTTHYGRPFTMARDQMVYPELQHVGCASCILDRPIVEVDLENLHTFIKEYKDWPYFAFQWINCPQHDDLNGASQVDKIIAKFFDDIHHLTENRTFVIFFSDHGYRWNNFVSTRIGHYESSLPMLTIATPRAFREKHLDLFNHMKLHKSTLLTPFDMFASLVDLKRISSLSGSLTNKPHHHEPPLKDLNKSSTNIPKKIHITQTPDDLKPSWVTASTLISEETIVNGTNYRHVFKPLSIFRKHSPAQLDRSCIEAGIPDNYCVCHEFKGVSTKTNDVIGAAYFYVYVHLYQIYLEHSDICHMLDIEGIEKAQVYDFKQSKRVNRKSKRGVTREALNMISKMTPSLASTVMHDEQVIDESHFLPNREYNIILTTKPGGALFQEVIRYYGDENMRDCNLAVKELLSLPIVGPGLTMSEKHIAVMNMNKICRYSIHSESISRLNLYKDQSKCVKSNIELKKVCYCKSL